MSREPETPTPTDAPADKAGHRAHDPALELLLSEMEALARILPAHDGLGPDASDAEQEAFFDNMPV